MFQDTKQELERLQAQLLEETEEEEQTAPGQEEDFLDEEIFDEILTDTDRVENCDVYQNFSNDYGKSLRNYASGYKAYNADKTEISPEQMSEELLESKDKSSILIWVLLTLIAAVFGVIVWIFLSMGGLS